VNVSAANEESDLHSHGNPEDEDFLREFYKEATPEFDDNTEDEPLLRECYNEQASAEERHLV